MEQLHRARVLTRMSEGNFSESPVISCDGTGQRELAKAMYLTLSSPAASTFLCRFLYSMISWHRRSGGNLQALNSKQGGILLISSATQL